MDEIKNMTKEELIGALENLRDARKKGYTQTPKVRKRKDPGLFDNLDPDLAVKLLELLKEE